MGVHGLWQLLQPAGRPVSLESLEGKVLAVDVSIWLHQTMKGMRDKDGNPLPNAHLQGLFSRVCKLLFYRIKPVFVFDGGVPELKKKTLAARRDRRVEAERESAEVAEKLLQNLVKSQAVKQALATGSEQAGPTTGTSSGSRPARVPGVRKGRNNKYEDVFELTPLPESEEISLVKEAEQWERDFEQQENWIKEGLAALSDTHPDAEEFKSLPAEIQHEILRELKERKKYHCLSHLTQMPEDSEDFSSYQLKRLMKKCRLTTRMEEVRREMTKQTVDDVTASLSGQYEGEECGRVKSQFGDQVEARRIVSEDAAHYVLIKGISSVGQFEQAGRYNLEQKVKVEDVGTDEENGAYITNRGPGGGSESSPEKKSAKASVKIVSTDESDSDVDIVVARRVRKKAVGKRKSSKKVKENLQREKNVAAKMEREELFDVRKTKATSKQKAPTVSNSSSEDEGFIEVTVDPDAAMIEDELFPASMFETHVHKNDVGSDKEDNTLENPSPDPKKKGEVGRQRNPIQTERILSTQKIPAEKQPMQADLGCKEKPGGHVRDGLSRGNTGSSSREKGALIKPPNMVTADRKEVLKDVVGQLEEKRREVGEPTDTVAVKRKSVLTDILGQLQEKKKKLAEEVTENNSIDVLLPIDDLGLGKKKASMVVNEKKSSKEVSEACSLGGGFIPEESSDSSDAAGTGKDDKERYTRTWKSDGANSKALSEESDGHSGSKDFHDSDSDEDLKLAKELSLQTDLSKTRADQKSESDEELQLAIKLSLQASEHEPGKASSDQDIKKSSDRTKTRYSSINTSDSLTSSQGDEGEHFQDVAEVDVGEPHFVDQVDENNEHGGDSQALGTDTGNSPGVTERGREWVDEDRFQPEDFEVDDEVESRAHIPAMNEDDLDDMREELANERSVLMSERGRQNRMATSVTEQINLEAQALLRLFGVPYIVSPLEAEAQCAFLEAAGLTQGTITDDSDFWLFGGCQMYKNFFNQNKHVELYTMNNIRNHFSLTREQLINIALLCGSDYTEGIQGVGPVRALEIMAEFPGQGLEGLYKFRQWWERVKKSSGMAIVGNKIRARLKNITLIPGFPSEAVVEAYMNPTVDESTERFSWAPPDLDLLREFSKHKFGWTKEKCDQTLVPMFKNWSKTQSQGRISSFFGPEAFVQTSKIKSDRLRKALEMVKNPGGGSQEQQEDTSKDKSGRSKRENSKSGDNVSKKKSKKEQGNVIDEMSKIEQKGGKSGDVAKNKSGRKCVSFSEKLEEPLESANSKAEAGMDGGLIDDSFMSGMSEKVSQARESLEKMKEARNFACVKGRGGGRGEGARGRGGKARGVKGRGKAKVTRGGSTVPISLDIVRKPSGSQRGSRLSARRGRSEASGTFTGAMNLSESSSSGSSDDDNGMDKGDNSDDCIPMVRNKEGMETRVSGEHQHDVIKTAKSSTLPGHSVPGPTRKCANKKEVVSIEVKAQTSSNLVEKPHIEQKSKSQSESKIDPAYPSSLLKERQGESNKNAMAISTKKISSGGKEMSNTNKKHVKANSKVKQHSTKGQGIASQSITEQVEIFQGTTNAQKPKTRGSKTGSPEGESREELAVLTQDGEGQRVDKSSGEVDETKQDGSGTDSVDMSKADVSVINRRNLPATLSYLNRRSHGDRVLLSQMSGHRHSNAIERRLEEEERRGPQLGSMLGRVSAREVEPVDRLGQETKMVSSEEDSEDPSRQGMDMESGLSFEEVLGGVDEQPVGMLKAKKRKISGQEIRPRSKKEEQKADDKSVPCDKEPNTNVSDKTFMKSTGVKTRKLHDNRLMSGELLKEKNVPVAKVEGRKAEKNLERRNKTRSSIVKRKESSGGKSSELVTINPTHKSNKSFACDISRTGETLDEAAALEDNMTSPVMLEEESMSQALLVNSPQQKLKKTESEREEDGKKLKLKSKRSRAFDRPIKAVESDEDGSFGSSPKASFQTQVTHLHEPKSVKGHGPLYVSAGRTLPRETGRAFAGKGKGRGKNRTQGEGSAGSFVVTQKEKEQYGSLTLDDLGSDFSDDGF